MLNRIDVWFGRAIMHPPIIWLCQRTGSSQYAVASYAWMLAAWTLIMRITLNGFSEWLWALLIVVIALLETAHAALYPDRPRRSSTSLRLIVLAFVTFDLVSLAIQTSRFAFADFNWGHAWDVFALIGEYAKTIRTIPPRKLREPKEKAVRPGTVSL